MIRKNLISNYVFSISNIALASVTFVILANGMSKESFGDFAMFLSFTAIGLNVVDFGMSSSASIVLQSHSGAKADGYYATVIAGVILRATLSLVFWGICCIIVGLLPNLSEVSSASMAIMLVGFILQPNWFLNAVEEMYSTITLYTCAKIILTSVLIVLFLHEKISNIYFWYSLSVSLPSILAFMLWVISSSKVSACYTDMNIKVIFTRMVQLFVRLRDVAISSMLGMAISSSPIIVAAIFYNSLVAAEMAVNDRLVKFILALIAPYTTSAIPHVSKGFSLGKTEGIVRIYRGLVLGLGGYTILALLIICNSDNVLSFFGASGEENSFFALLMFLFWGFLGVLNNFIGFQALALSGRELEYRRAFTLSAIVITLCYFALYGRTWGIPISLVLGEISLTLTCLIYYRSMNRYL